MADEPLEKLGGVPPWRCEHPQYEEIVQKGQTGLIPDDTAGMPPGSMWPRSPVLVMTRRSTTVAAPLEAAKLGSSWA